MEPQVNRTETTMLALRNAIEVYSREVMNKDNWVKKGGRDQYRYAISKERIYELADVRSRSTLSSPRYSQVRVEIDDAIAKLKKAAGKIRGGESSEKVNDEDRIRILQQVIVAQDFEIARLQSQLNLPQKVVSIDKTRKWSG